MEQDLIDSKKIYDTYAKIYCDKQNSYISALQCRSIVNKFIKRPKNKKILFAGCGDAEEARYCIEAGAIVTGVDISSKCISLAKRKFKAINLLEMDFGATSFADNSFDILVSLFTVMYKKDLNEVLNEFSRIVKPGGQIIIAVHHPVRKMFRFGNLNYFKKGRHDEKWTDFIRFNYYRTFSDYINAIVKSKLQIIKVVEPELPLIDEYNGQETKQPHVLIFNLAKLV